MSYEIDNRPRYVPAYVMTLKGMQQVSGVVSYPASGHPDKCPIVATMVAVHVQVPNSAGRWYGVDKAWINSELRMVVQGFNAKFEELAAWTVCEQP